MNQTVFITGGTGFMGRDLIMELVRRGYVIRALARHGSESKLPQGCHVVPGDALDKASFVSQIAPAETFVQLIGVTHPNPSKKDEFRAVDLGSARAAIAGAREAGIKHFVYVSVAQPAPVMKDYIAVRAEAEKDDPRKRHERHDSSPVVRAGARQALAAVSKTDVLADGADSVHAGFGEETGTRYAGTNGGRTGAIG